jgi:para-nitrobenzyl esterase
MASQDSEKVPTEVITTVEGPIRGIVEDGISTFRGIPYAAPPVGALRWAATAPVTPWSEVLETTTNGASPLQDEKMCEAVGGGHPGVMDESCLYLNVWSPRLDSSAKLPVMVWIFGGAYIIGASGLATYDGRPFASKGAVVVSFNYRLGCLGFFKHAKLEAETAGDKVKLNNFALLDQIAALEWVNRNIEKFGGDPNNVTIFGQSAGARSVLALFASPLVTGREAKGLPPLFHKGIAQSVYRMKEALGLKAQTRATKLVKELGLTGEAVTAAALRELDAEKLININQETPLTEEQLKGTSNSPVAIAGDDVLPKGVFESFVAGEALRLPLIIGHTSDDVSVVLDSELTPQNMIKFSGKAADVLVKYYPDLEQDPERLDTEEIGRRVGRDGFFAEVTNRIAHAHAKHGAPAWQYYYDYTAEGLRPTVTKGTRHGDDVCFTMNTLEHAPIYPPPATSPPTTEKVVFTPADKDFAAKVSEYWFQFARAGVPSSAGSQDWPQTTEEHSNTLVLGNAAGTDKGQITLDPDFNKTHMPRFREIGGSYDLIIFARP